MVDLKILHVAQGKAFADLAVTNGRIVNVHTREIYPGGVAVVGERIAVQGDIDYTIGPETTVIDAEGQFIVPGFLEGHIHPESSCMSMTRFAEIALAHGTTSVFTDLHEIGIVAGQPGIDAALKEANDAGIKFYWVVPSHIPFFPGLETSGAIFDSDHIGPQLARPDAVGLSEVVSFYVNAEHGDLFKSIGAAHLNGRALVGHGPETKGKDWNAFVSVGITNDHEAIDAEDVLLRTRNGVYAHLRHNLICETLPVLLKPILEGKIDTRYICLATDDTSAITLSQKGHIDYLARLAMSCGVDFVTALQMITINVACSFRVEHEVGSLSPSRWADINIITEGKDFQVLKTISKGKLVAANGHLTTPAVDPVHPPVMLHTFHLKARPTAKDLVISAKDGATSARVHYMTTLPWIPLTKGGETTLPVKNGSIACDPSRDIIHIAVVERHLKTGNIGRGFMGGFGLREGAIASSVAHDNHNIVVIGATPEDCALAVNRVVDLEGGIVMVNGGRVVHELALPLFGLLADMDAWTLAKHRQTMLDTAKAWGSTVLEPFMFLSFVTLVGFPEYSVTDHGYVDCIRQVKMEPVLEYV
jgi:adenine deaminase